MDIICFPTVCFSDLRYIKAQSFAVFVCCVCECDCLSTVSDSPFLFVPACLCPPQQVIPEGLLIFVWVQQHSIKLVKYAQGYLSQPERLWTYLSPSNRCTDYGLQLSPEEWLKQPVSQAQTKPSCNVQLFFKGQVVNNITTYWEPSGSCTSARHYQYHKGCFQVCMIINSVLIKSMDSGLSWFIHHFINNFFRSKS